MQCPPVHILRSFLGCDQGWLICFKMAWRAKPGPFPWCTYSSSSLGYFFCCFQQQALWDGTSLSFLVCTSAQHAGCTARKNNLRTGEVPTRLAAWRRMRSSDLSAVCGEEVEMEFRWNETWKDWFYKLRVFCLTALLWSGQALYGAVKSQAKSWLRRMQLMTTKLITF